jgi:hypothetical protein
MGFYLFSAGVIFAWIFAVTARLLRQCLLP